MASTKKKPARRKSPAALLTGKRVLPLSEVRSQLSPLVRTLKKQSGAVGIAVRGKVEAYLVAAQRYEESLPPARGRAFSLEGSIKWLGNPDDIPAAIKQGREEMMAETLREWDELNSE